MKVICMGTVDEVGMTAACGVFLYGDPNETVPEKISHGLCEYCRESYQRQLDKVKCLHPLTGCRCSADVKLRDAIFSPRKEN